MDSNEFITGVIEIIENYANSKPDKSADYFIEQIVDIVIKYERSTGLLNKEV